MSVTDHAGYLTHAFQGADIIIEQAREHIDGIKFDTFVGRGLSGALVVPTLAAAFEKTFMIVRKEGEYAHSHRMCEGILGKRWLFVDDLIQSGNTFVAVRDAIKAFIDYKKFTTKCAGAYLYGSDSEESYPDEFISPANLRIRVGTTRLA